MNTMLLIALALPTIGSLLLVWPCLLLSARAEARIPHHPDLD